MLLAQFNAIEIHGWGSRLPKAEKPDCTPPYYFDGSKKIFKPACL